LGTVGVGLVIARNVLERRAEMGVMSALGFRRKALVRMVLSEHLMLVVAGVVIGAVAALAAVAPNLVGRAAGFPMATVGVMVLAIAVGGLVFCVVAARLALRGSLLDAIRSE
jgi:ABC-type antimicrobial peptide transport system permease subunit